MANYNFSKTFLKFKNMKQQVTKRNTNTTKTTKFIQTKHAIFMHKNNLQIERMELTTE